MKKAILLFAATFLFLSVWSQNIGINSTGALPNAKAILDLASTNAGMLIPRMTTAQRDAIAAPPIGLQVYNITTNTLDIYKGTTWLSVAYAPPASIIVFVYSMADLPAPVATVITLNLAHIYIISGIIDISPNSINLNGAVIRGTAPSKDGVRSTVSGAVLRSTGVSVFIENLMVIPASGSTKAFDFADATKTKYCNLRPGTFVVDNGGPSLGVGQVSGFEAIIIKQNFWDCKDGIKVSGNVGLFVAAFNLVHGISAGAGIEFKTGLTINHIELSSNYFHYTGQTGIIVNNGVTIDRGRMNSNMFLDVGTFITGFDSYTPSWDMRQNTNIPNTRAYAFVHMNNNTVSTLALVDKVFKKIAGTTSVINSKRFTADHNKLTYIGKDVITGKVSIVISSKAANGYDFSIAIAKNGTIIPVPYGSMASASNNQSFQITFITEVDLATNDFIEVWIRTNSGTNSIVVDELQFRVTD